MKTPTLYIKRCLLVVALLTASALSVQATDTFKARVRTTAQQTMNISLSASDTIPLSNLGTIYALSIDAIITQPREASFVRIVLEDVEGHNYLIAESDRFRNDTTTVNLSEYCEETAQLNGITPLRLKCYLTHASLQLTGIHISNEMPTRGVATEHELRSMKEEQVQDIVDRINEYNVKHGKLWQAAATPYALRSAESQGTIGADDPYLANMKYYAGGLYEIGERNRQATTYNSPYADSFDWSKTRHGKCWITSIKNQGNHGPCHIFAAVGVAEAMTNLYFNDTINLNLSEQDIITYTRYNETGHWSTYTLDTPIRFIATDGVIDETTLPYGTIISYTDPRPSGLEFVSFNDVIEVSPSGMNFDNFCDSIKKHLINDGPGVWGSLFPSNEPPKYSHHYMALVGYGKVKSNDSYHIIYGNSNSYQHPPQILVGKTYWNFKNSYGSSESPYMKLIFNDDAYLYSAFFAKKPITRRGHHTIKCEDRDGDGYYNWGISDTPPSTLPAWAFTERDADDMNRYEGALDTLGHVASISENNNWKYISNTQYVSTPTFNRRPIIIENGGKLIVTNDFKCFPNTDIIVESGGTLDIQGGKVLDAKVELEAGAKLKISDYGELRVLSADTTIFEVPLGATLEMDFNSSITKSNVEYPNAGELYTLGLACPCLYE